MNDDDPTIPTDDESEGHLARPGRPRIRLMTDAGTPEGDTEEGADTEGHIADPGRPRIRIMTDAGTPEGDTDEGADTEGHIAQPGRPRIRLMTDAGTEGDDTEGHAINFKGVSGPDIDDNEGDMALERG